MHPLDAELQDQLRDTRALLAALKDALARFGASAGDQATLDASVQQLDELFLLVVVGEFNAGKSAFINALLGTSVLREGVTPTTSQIQLLAYGPADSTRVDPRGVLVIQTPVPLLQEVHVVDTPGTNAIMREHELLTTAFVPRADLVLFVTSADRPFTETERAFLETIRDWGKKVVLVINKADIFEREADLEEVTTFVRSAAQSLLGVAPPVFAVSARLAFRARSGDPAAWAASRFEPLEQFIQELLLSRSRFALKLANPLGVGQALATRYGTIAVERLQLLEEDLTLLADIDHRLSAAREELARAFDLRMAAINGQLTEMEARGHAYFDDTLRLGRVFDLLNRARVQKEFEDRVVGDTPRQIERQVADLTDWLVDQDFRQWQAVTARLAERTRLHAPRILGSPEIGSFHTDRARLIAAVGGETQRVVDTYDKQREAAAIADQARDAVTRAAAAGGAAIGLGTIVTIAASSAAADVTGIVMASLVAALGFLVIPRRRRVAKAEMKAKMTNLRQRLASVLRAEFDRARSQGSHRLNDAIAPYRQFVEGEQQRFLDARTTLEALRQRADALRERLARDAAPGARKTA
jgi:small GTP-binding protein